MSIVVFGTFLTWMCLASPGDADLDTAAITVYRNPEFFKHLSEEFNDHLQHFGKDSQDNPGVRDRYHSPVDADSYVHHYSKKYNRNYPDESENQENADEEQQEQSDEADEESYNEEPEDQSDDKYQQDEELNEEEDEKEAQEEEDGDGYKYPGEPKKPNPPVRPNVNVHYDGSVDFDHPPRDLPPPKKPKKKGRGPYGHPRYTEDYRDNPSSYSKLYRDAQKKSEEELLAEIEEESRRHRNGDSYPYGEVRSQEKYEVYPRRYPLDVDDYKDDEQHLPLKVYHQGQRYPVKPRDYIDDEEVQFPLESQQTRPSKHNSYPVEDVRETKKGTREYLKHHKRPGSHELEDLRSQQKKKEKKPVIISCDTVVRRKPKTYLAYRVRPVYSQYRVVPHRPSRQRRRYYVKPKRSTAPKSAEDDSAYVVSSDLDNDYQKLPHKAKPSG